jgi:hypothetical protein
MKNRRTMKQLKVLNGRRFFVFIFLFFIDPHSIQSVNTPLTMVRSLIVIKEEKS